MKLLTSDSFEKARTFVMEQGRELERRLLSYYFDDGTPAAVLDELASYQNQDGGFGNGLEPDIQLPDSSVITTTIALRILREVKATSDDEIVQKAIQYLLAEYDSAQSRWPIVPQAVDEYPHAPWWNFENTADTFGNFLANPRAEVVGYLHEYHELAPTDLTKQLTVEVIEHIKTLSDEMNMYDFICCVHLVETAGPAPIRERYVGGNTNSESTLRRRSYAGRIDATLCQTALVSSYAHLVASRDAEERSRYEFGF